MREEDRRHKCKQCGKDGKTERIIRNGGVAEYWCRECIESMKEYRHGDNR